MTFISSTDGLNIYNGLSSIAYRPSTHHMYGLNVQGKFYSDTFGKVWFATYEALNYYDPEIDDINYRFMFSSNGDTIKENYKAFHMDRNDLYLKAGTEVFVFDIARQTIKERYFINLKDYFELAILSYQDKIILFAGDNQGYSVYELKSNGKYTLLDHGKEAISCVITTSQHILWFGTNDGKIGMYDVSDYKMGPQYKLTQTIISGIAILSNSKLLVAATSNVLMEFDLNTRIVSNLIYPVNSSTGDPLNSLIIPYLDEDSTLWIGINGQGVFFCSLNNLKFQHLLSRMPGELKMSVTKILEIRQGTFLVLTRGNGICLMKHDGSIIKHWHDLPGGQSNFTAISGTMLDDRNLLFCSGNNLYALNVQEQQIIPQNFLLGENWMFRQIDRLANGRIVASCEKGLLHEILWHDHQINFRPYGQLEGKSQMTLYFKSDKLGNIYISNDEVSILVLSPTSDNNSHTYSYTLKISGGIRGLSDDLDHNAVYISNTQGLFHLDLATKNYKQIIDKDKLLLQTIYSVIADEVGDLWLGTNKGIMRYSPANGSVKVFTEMDGIQGLEYNTNAYLKTSDGHMLFGGVNGLNYFHPGEIRFSEKDAPIYVSELWINDELDSTFRVPQYIDEINLKYKQNTVSFEFHAIDYSDPAATRVKYKMIGVDDEYIESKTQQGFARYANLAPGEYVLSILGANSDGHWNEIPKEMAITIYPPFWLTWWFISLAILSITGLGYWAVRSYFQRKLEKKNQLLREQILIIEKQQAVEHERTRIASEMHDDLGSGLTTIRYLSDKALTQAKDADEVNQIKKIAEQSNVLVRNMSEIIWAMNARFDNADSLTSYLRRYASEYLDAYKLPLTFTASDEALDQIPLSGERRRNIFLVFKETLHNTIKYSEANAVHVNISTGDNFMVHITEVGGKGFDPEATIEKGNGIYNSRKRMTAIGGDIQYERTPEAMHIILSIPLQATHHV